MKNRFFRKSSFYKHESKLIKKTKHNTKKVVNICIIYFFEKYERKYLKLYFLYMQQTLLKILLKAKSKINK